jgi:hypothetical protein
MLITQAIIAASGLLAVVIASVSFTKTSKRQREIEKNSMYQRLELASIEFFRWEAANRAELIETREKYPDVSAEDDKLLETYCNQLMNLFELCIHNENMRMLPPKVFGSWLPWIYEVAHEPGFKEFWSKTKPNYLPECRKVIECAIKNRRDIFIVDMCEEYHLEKEDWMEYENNN